MASLVQLVQSLNQDERKLDFEGAMDRLERKSKKGNPLVIDLTNPEEEGASSDNSSVSSTHDSDDSDYMVGNDGLKERHKKTASSKKLETPDKGNSPRNKNDSLTMLSNVCGDMIEEESEDTEEEISVNENNCDNNNFLDDLFNADCNDELEDKEDKRKRDQEEDQKSGDASNRFNKQDDTSIDLDSADGVEKGRKKK